MTVDRYGIYWVNLDPVLGGEIAIDQIRTIAKARLGERIDTLEPAVAASVRHVIMEM